MNLLTYLENGLEMDEQCDICCEYSSETIETDDGVVICSECQGIADDEVSLLS